MANKTIHELSPATTVGSGYEFAIYDTDNNTTKKATVSDILSTSDLLYADDDETPTGEVDFSSQDTSLSPSSSVSVDLLSGDDSWSARFVKISQMFKNIRFLFSKLGTTDISSIGNGTVTGALSTLNGNFIKQSVPASVYSNRATISENVCFKCGNIVFVNIRATSNQALSGNTTFTGLPVPTYKQYLSVSVAGAFADIRTTQADGIVVTGVPSSSEFVISGAYIL